MIKEESVAPVARIFKPHGFKGELNLEISLDPEFFNNPKTPFFVKIDNIFVPFFVENISGGSRMRSYIKFKGINSDKEAEMLVNKTLYSLKNLVAESLGLSESELDLAAENFIGFKVMDEATGGTIGFVRDIEEGIEYDYLSVEVPNKKNNISIPFIDEFIKGIVEDSETKAGEITVSLPDGFLEI